MRKVYTFILVFFSLLSLNAQGFPPDENIEDLLVKADLTAEKRLSDFLSDYFVEDMWGSYYAGPTVLDISGEITRSDLDVIFQIKTIKKIDAEHAFFVDNIVPTYAFCMDVGLYQIGITTLEEIILPKSIEVIDAMSFTGCERLSKVNLSQLESLRKIGMNAFDKCALASLYIPEKCVEIGDNAFAFCLNMSEIIVAPGNKKYEAENNALYDNSVNALILYPKLAENRSLTVKAGTDSIVASCFKGNVSLETISLPNSLTKIGRFAFEETTKLKSISIPGSVKKLESLFSNSAIENVTLGDGVEILGVALFDRCSSLKSVRLPKSVKRIGYMAFYNCKNLITFDFPALTELNLIDERAFLNCESLEIVDLSNAKDLSAIGNGSFKDCSSLHTLLLPDGIKKIDSEAFYNCELLDLKKYPSSLTYVGDYAFGNNMSLTTISVGDFVNFLGNGVFSNCRNVTNLEVSENNLDYILYENMIFTMDGSSIIYVSPETSIQELDLSEINEVGDYILAGNKSIKKIYLGNGLTSIGEGAFQDMTQLQEINLSHCVNLTKIGNSAFKGAVSLKSINFPKDDSSKFLEIGMNAFEGCNALKELVLPAQLTSLGLYSFKDCMNLKKIDLSKTELTSISDAFINCESLSDILFNNKIIRFGDNAFRNCKSLKTLEIPRSISYNLNAMPFAGSGIESFTVSPDNKSYKTIDGAIYSKDGSQFVVCPPTVSGEYTIPEGVTKVGAKAFSGNDLITKIILPNTVLAPGYQNIVDSFHEMHGLTSFGASEDHKTIKIIDDAIYCNQGKTLYAYPAGKIDTKITLAPTLELIGRSAFNGNKIVEEINFPEGMTGIEMSFLNAIGLRKIILPASIKSFSSSFDGALNLSEVICNAVLPPRIDVFTFRKAPVMAVYVPQESLDAYKDDKYWSNYNIFPITPTSLEVNNDTNLRVICKDRNVQIISDVSVLKVNIYNMNGQLIKSVNSETFKLDTPSNTLVIISVLLENGEQVNSKLIVR